MFAQSGVSRYHKINQDAAAKRYVCSQQQCTTHIAVSDALSPDKLGAVSTQQYLTGLHTFE